MADLTLMAANRSRRLIFINLAIDQLWDSTGHLQRLYPSRSPESERLVRANEDLGLFLSQPGDVVLGAQFEPEHLKLLERWSAPFGRPVNVRANPCDFHHWVGEVEQMEIAQHPFEFWPCSLSPLENSLLAKIPSWKLPPWLPASLNTVAFNQKTSIFKWGEIAQLPVPRTSIVSIAKLLNEGSPTEIEYPLVLKADWGSGGCGNLNLQSKDDNRWRHFQRQLRGQTTGRWLVQKVIKAELNLTVFGFADGSSPLIMNVEYDRDGLSVRHRDFDFQSAKPLAAAFLRVAHHLKELKYTGPFSFDVVVEKGSGEVYLLDMNVRWTRTHLLDLAARRLGQDWGKVESRRLRFQGRSINSFSAWWRAMSELLNIDESGRDPRGHTFLPYSVAGSDTEGQSIKEVSYFVSTGSVDWISQVAAAIQRWASPESAAG